MIAHRLETAVTFSDKVLVMDKGSVAEFDHSYKLLAREEDISADTAVDSDLAAPTTDTLFASMVRALTP